MIGLGLQLASGRRGYSWEAVPDLAGLWLPSVVASLTSARDGTGGPPADAGAIGRILDLSGNNYYLESSADGARPAWYQNGFRLGCPSIYSENTAHDLSNATTLAADIFSGTDPSFTVILLMARRSEVFGGSTCYQWGVQKNGGSIAGGAGNPFFGTRIDNSVYSNTRPFTASVFGGDADTSIQGGTITYDDGGLAIGYGNGVGVLTRVEDGLANRTYWNGHQLASVVKTSRVYTFASGDRFTVGKTFNGTTRTGLLFGHWYACAVYSRALSDDERAYVEGHLLSLVGVSYSAAPIALPPSLVFIGHSMFLSNVPETPTPPYLIARGNRIPWHYRVKIWNQSIGGQRLSSIGADNDQQDALTYKVSPTNRIKSNDIGIHRGCTNDWQDVDTDEATMDAGIVAEQAALLTLADTFLQKATLGGFIHVADPTTGPGSLTDGLTPTQRAVRRYGLGKWPAAAAAVLGRFDRAELFNSHAALSDGTDILPTIYNSGDGVHLSYEGYDVETDGIAPLVNRLDAFNPATHANLVRWFSGRNQSIALTDAAAMSAIVDLSATGDDATQATGAAQPTFRIGTETSNYKATERFDGVDDELAFTSLALTNHTTILILDPNSYSAILSGSGGQVLYVGGGSIAIVGNAGNGLGFTLPASFAAFDIVVLRSDGKCWVNGIPAAAYLDEGFAANPATTWTTLGSHVGSDFYSGDLGDLFIFNAALPDADVNDYGRHLAVTFGKTWTTI